MNPKNTLQEFCLARKATLPIYDTFRVGGTEHQPLFSSTVRIELEEGKPFEKDGRLCSTKKLAESSAAELMLEYLEFLELKESDDDEYRTESDDERKTPQKFTPKSSKEEDNSGKIIEYVFIDIENAASCVNDLKTLRKRDPKRFKSMIFYGFLSSLSPLTQKIPELTAAGISIVKTVRSSVKDAADVLLISLLTSHIVSKAYSGEDYEVPITIITRDHYGGALVDVMREEWPLVNLRHLGSVLDLY